MLAVMCAESDGSRIKRAISIDTLQLDPRLSRIAASDCHHPYAQASSAVG